MAGKKNFVSVKEDGHKVHKQKRLLLSNLKETFRSFKDKYPDIKVSFSKFSELRPKHCVLPGASGTHSVCVCAHHENVKLLIDGGNIAKLTADLDRPMKNYKDLLSHITCNPASPDCYFRKCQNCPSTEELMQYLKEAFETKMIDIVNYKQWITVDRTNLEILQSSVDEYLDKLSTKIEALAPHTFIAQQQAAFLAEKKETLQDGECIVICDFSENYACVIQDSVQGVHWNKTQATLHPFVIYFKDRNELQHENFVSISECLKHDTNAVHLFQRQLINFLKHKIGNVKRIIYFSDGASAQYKNRKNFLNLCFHEEDFCTSAEWHFFGTSHGKGPCDGIGGTTKRLATKASLQLNQDPITTPQKLFVWAEKNVRGINFSFTSNEDYRKECDLLRSRYQKTKPISGTRTLHAFIPVSKSQALVKDYSLSHENKIVFI